MLNIMNTARDSDTVSCSVCTAIDMDIQSGYRGELIFPYLGKW